ncbi:MAG TPA: hypothetical protein VHA54_07560 [Solirubrobacterales bacterium]|nr:hypothetical protein [Solirubrobacterales bacterium]
MSSSGSTHEDDRDRRSAREPVCGSDYERARQANLEADTRLKEAQAQALEDARALLAGKQRGQELDNEIKELKRGTMLIGVVLVLGLLVAELALAILAPEITHPGQAPLGLAHLLLGR